MPGLVDDEVKGEVINEEDKQQKSEGSAEECLELKLRQEKVCLLRRQLEELKTTNSQTAVPQLATNKIVMAVTQHFGKRDKDNAKKKLPPSDLLKQRIQNWAGYLYPKIRQLHLCHLENLEMYEQLDKIMIIQTAEWTKAAANSSVKYAEETQLGLWERQFLAFMKEFAKYKKDFEKVHKVDYGSDESVVCTTVKHGSEVYLEYLDFSTIRFGRAYDISIKLDDEDLECCCSVEVDGLDDWVKECFSTKRSVSYLMHGFGFGDSKGVWWLIDEHVGGATEQMLDDIDVDELSAP